MLINFLLGFSVVICILFTIASIVFAVSYILSMPVELALIYTLLIPFGLMALIMLVAGTIQLGSYIRNGM